MINTSSLSDQVEQTIKKDILSGVLAPGQRISIDKLAESLGVSSMPVRDAVRLLETAGFLTISSRRGVFVSRFDRHRFKNVFAIRIALECLAVELSILRIPVEEIEQGIHLYHEVGTQSGDKVSSVELFDKDNYVHDLIMKYCDNPELITIIRGMQDLIDWGHKIVAIYQPGAIDHALPEHIAVLEALKTRDLEGAVRAMRSHLQGTLRRTLAGWQSTEVER